MASSIDLVVLKARAHLSVIEQFGHLKSGFISEWVHDEHYRSLMLLAESEMVKLHPEVKATMNQKEWKKHYTPNIPGRFKDGEIVKQARAYYDALKYFIGVNQGNPSYQC